jgi:hypothetical protein
VAPRRAWGTRAKSSPVPANDERADKYDQREADGSPDEWARTALPVAVEIDD